MLGLRGQGQSPTARRGVGEEVLGVYRRLAAELAQDGRTTTLVAVRHPGRLSATLASYDADIAAGRRMTAAALASSLRRCPASDAILAGFSQGAQIVHLTAAALPAPTRARVAAVVLMGDPLRDPDARVRHLDLGDGPATGRGSNGRGAGFGSLHRRVIEVCVAGDNVCNVPETGRVGGISPVHRHAYESAAAADRIAQEAVAAYRAAR